MTEKQYLPGSAREIYTQHGSILKLNLPATDTMKFIQEHADENGWIRLNITPVKTPTEKRTHSVWLDTWRPGGERGKPQPKPTQPHSPGSTPGNAADSDAGQDHSSDDVPF